MKIAMLGSLGNVNRHAIPQLLADGHEVTVMTSTPERQAEIEALGAHSQVGDLTNVDDLTRLMTGADIAYLMLTGRATGSLVAHGRQAAEVFTTAIQASGIKRVVNLSSVGADQGPEIGALYVYNIIESALSALNIDVTFVRPVAFYDNLMSTIKTVREHHTIINNFPAEHMNAYVWPADIADTVVDALENFQPGLNVRYVVSDMFTGTELINALQVALDMPDLHWTEIDDAQMLANMTKAGMPEVVANEFVKLGASQRTETAYTDLREHMPVHGQYKLANFVSRYQAAYNQQ